MNSTPGRCVEIAASCPVMRLSSTRTLMSAANELFGEVRTDETGAAGDEV